MHEQRDNSHVTNDALQAGTRSPYLLWLIWVIWLPFILPALINLLQSHFPPAHLIAMLIGVALFLALYLWATWQTARHLVIPSTPTRRREVSIWLITAVLAIVSFALGWSSGDETQWLSPLIFTSGYAGGSLRTAQAILAVVTLTLSLIIIAYLMHLSWPDLLQGGVFVAAVGFIAMSVVRSIKTGWELRVARAEIAHLAVTTERLRIARDLHDLLGHNLSLIALKSELARRLIHVAPQRAVSEIGDVEQVARTTLQEVREAVSSYRQPTLLNELHAAQEILAAAGIAYHFAGAEKLHDPLPTAIEAALAWAVREGVTNVIRHSRAQQCTITLKQEQATVSVEVIDNGPYTTDQPDDNSHTNSKGGNGLHGLAERIAALDGQFAAGPHTPYTDSGFRLAVSLPLSKHANNSSDKARSEQQ